MEEIYDFIEDWECPHCKSKRGIWFDRSSVCDEEGNTIEYENFPTRCNECGKNINAPLKYYEEKTPIKNKEYIEELESTLIDILPSDWDATDISYFCDLSMERSREIHKFLKKVIKNYKEKHNIG